MEGWPALLLNDLDWLASRSGRRQGRYTRQQRRLSGAIVPIAAGAIVPIIGSATVMVAATVPITMMVAIDFGALQRNLVRYCLNRRHGRIGRGRGCGDRERAERNCGQRACDRNVSETTPEGRCLGEQNGFLSSDDESLVGSSDLSVVAAAAHRSNTRLRHWDWGAIYLPVGCEGQVCEQPSGLL